MAAGTLDLFANGAPSAAAATNESGAGALIAGRTRLIEGVEGFVALERVWRSLARVAPDHAAFSAYGFALAAARYHEARGDRVLAVVADWDGRPACILPVAITRRAGLSVAIFLGDPIAQYGDALTIAHAPNRVVELALKRLAATPGIDVLELRRVRDDAAIRRALSRMGRSVGVAVEAPHADLAFEASVDAYLLAVGGAKQKRERGRSRRRLEERGALAFETFRGLAAIEPLRAAFALKADWLARHGDASPVIGDPLALTALEEFAADPRDGGDVVVGRLSVGGEPAAYEVGLVKGRRFHAFLGAVAERFACGSPGKVAMEETLRWCRAEGIDLYDLLPPADPYKRRWTNGASTVRGYAVPVTRAGRVYCGAWLGVVRPRLRIALDRLPDGLRHAAGTFALRAGAR